MIALLRVELTRLRWRRAVLLLLAAMVVVPVVIGAITLVDQQPLADDAYAQAEAEAERAVQDDPYYAQELERCVEDPDYYGVLPEEDAQATCESYILPTADQFLDYNPLDLALARDDSGLVVAVVVCLLALLVGTTFAGHDWNTGSMSNQLLFETRRSRVWGAKALAVVLTTGVVAAVGSTVFWLVLAARFWAGGLDVDGTVLLGSLQQGWRGAGVAAVGGLAGYALTMLSRSTVFTLGVLFGVAVAGGLFIGLLVDDPGWVDPTLNAAAVIEDGREYYVEVPESCYAQFESADGQVDEECRSTKVRSLEDGLLYLGVLTAAVGAASVVSYRRRDVP